MLPTAHNPKIIAAAPRIMALEAQGHTGPLKAR